MDLIEIIVYGRITNAIKIMQNDIDKNEAIRILNDITRPY